MKYPPALVFARAFTRFQQQAEAVAARFGIPTVDTHTKASVDDGIRFYCTYERPNSATFLLGLRPAQSPCAASPRQAVRYLEATLRQVYPEHFSTN